MPHPKEPVEYPDDRFSEDELAILTAEPTLIVEHIPDEETPEKELTIDTMTVAQIKAELDIKGIEYSDKALKAELFELYEGAKGESESFDQEALGR